METQPKTEEEVMRECRGKGKGIHVRGEVKERVSAGVPNKVSRADFFNSYLNVRV